jgi:hypothetical protein
LQPLKQLVIDIEIANYIQHCITFLNDIYFHQKFNNGLPFFHESFVYASTNQFFIIITSLS